MRGNGKQKLVGSHFIAVSIPTVASHVRRQYHALATFSVLFSLVSWSIRSGLKLVYRWRQNDKKQVQKYPQQHAIIFESIIQ